MTRRQAILAVIGLPMGQYAPVLPSRRPAHLQINLNQWVGVEVLYGNETLVLSPGAIFTALAAPDLRPAPGSQKP